MIQKFISLKIDRDFRLWTRPKRADAIVQKMEIENAPPASRDMFNLMLLVQTIIICTDKIPRLDRPPDLRGIGTDPGAATVVQSEKQNINHILHLFFSISTQYGKI